MHHPNRGPNVVVVQGGGHGGWGGHGGALQHGAVVSLRNRNTGGNVRIAPNGDVNANGGNGVPAKFLVQRNGDIVKFQNRSTNTFLACGGNGNMRAAPMGGHNAAFVAERQGPGHFQFRAVSGSGYMGFQQDGWGKPAQSVGNGPAGRFDVHRWF
jgi:hypothetical protein